MNRKTEELKPLVSQFHSTLLTLSRKEADLDLLLRMIAKKCCPLLEGEKIPNTMLEGEVIYAIKGSSVLKACLTGIGLEAESELAYSYTS